MPTAYKLLGITDERTNCECCGRADLKKTVVLETTEGTIQYFGIECAARALGTTKAAVSKGLISLTKQAAEERTRERMRRDAEEWTRYDAWKLATYGDKTNNIERHRQYRAEMGA